MKQPNPVLAGNVKKTTCFEKHVGSNVTWVKMSRGHFVAVKEDNRKLENILHQQQQNFSSTLKRRQQQLILSSSATGVQSETPRVLLRQGTQE